MIITDYIALLPPSSYHITLRGIKERYRCQSGKEYNDYIISNYLKLCELDKIYAESDLSCIEFDFDIKNEEMLQHSGTSICFNCAKNDEICLRKLETLSINHLGLHQGDQNWHLSLGYFYKN